MDEVCLEHPFRRGIIESGEFPDVVDKEGLERFPLGFDEGQFVRKRHQLLTRFLASFARLAFVAAGQEERALCITSVARGDLEHSSASPVLFGVRGWFSSPSVVVLEVAAGRVTRLAQMLDGDRAISAFLRVEPGDHMPPDQVVALELPPVVDRLQVDVVV